MWWSFAAADAADAEWLRPAVLQYLRARGTDDSNYGSAELIFGELIGNVVRHAPGEIASAPIGRRTISRSSRSPIVGAASPGARSCQ
jgi:anti-sigma regulatory factor (Ser/Thr protein kinase)